MSKGFLPLTARQRAAFWEAHRAACVNLELSTREEREAYRKLVMREECGRLHLSELNRTDDFDRVMARFAKDAGDWQEASRFAVADEARQAALIRICLAQVMQLKGCPAGSVAGAEYLAGIVEQARIPCGRDVRDSSFWLDVAPGSLLVLFQILDTHRRRMLRQLASDAPLGFDAGAVYALKESGDGVVIKWEPGAYAELNQSIHVNVKGGRR